ncbi:MAG: c-type cytochrome [Opitutaceae bacterium]|jgi:sulfur-oxidizing protein SoxX|nr:c-type cytochrome [Opitutaceae bacterium]
MKTSLVVPAKLGLAGAAALFVLLVGCSDPKSGTGFRLPDGEVGAGREAFVRLNCHLCHTVSGEKFATAPVAGVIVVPLGGEVVRVKTYGQLVTSIINPQHIVSPNYKGKYTDAAGKSLMPDYNQGMTVDELINLVAYLQSRYKLKLPDPAYPMGM